MKKPPLELKFDPNTIDDLGAKLYSTLPPILSELIANGYDAGASEIKIDFIDQSSDEKKIIISDNGQGMSYDEINDHYLIVGRKRRTQSNTHDPIFNRPVMGKKGIGKLAFFGITDKAKITTTKNGETIIFDMDRQKIDENQIYQPNFIIENTAQEAGTTIELFNIKRKTGFDIEDIKNSLANYFIFDNNFRVFISHNNGEYTEINNQTRYNQLDIEFTWQIPSDKFKANFTVTGKIFTNRKPIPKKLRGITLLARKKLVNLPELFPIDSSSHFYEYLTGYLEVDFIDDLPEDVISTDRKALNWGSSYLAELETWLKLLVNGIERDWRPKRKQTKKDNIKLDQRIKERQDTIKTEQGKEDFESSLDAVVEADADTSQALKIFYAITKDYPELHNAHLVEELKQLTEDHYKNDRYFDAVMDGAKRYIGNLRKKIGKHDGDENSVIVEAFKEKDAALSVTAKYNAYENPNTGAKINDDTQKTIERGNLLLSRAMLAAFRNPIAHQEYEDLYASGIFTAQDCLDALSLLSHLFRRLDNSVPKTMRSEHSDPQ